ncbi:MAG: class I mannose-6-phosphate isomerase [Novosphingobium sp.]|nr:class I mannose-6-phosphate isomerase [Novosphingobium sp.]
MSGILPVRQMEKPWGKDDLPAPFTTVPGRRIGEIWFEPPPELPQLLVKYIFTSEALSVQVHPSEAQRPGHGKEECWLIVDAEPGAKLGIGFGAPLDADAMRKAAIDGSIEHLLTWHSVAPGDFFYVPANTVHAIGAGVSLIEVQQNSDVTYRLYDYGRPRELHLAEGMAVARGEPYDRARWHAAVPREGTVTLCDGPWFRLDQVAGPPPETVAARYGDAPLLVIPREGVFHVNGAPVRAGQCAVADDLPGVDFPRYGVALIAQPCAI